jgi:hypothetical protein
VNYIFNFIFIKIHKYINMIDLENITSVFTSVLNFFLSLFPILIGIMEILVLYSYYDQNYSFKFM